MIDVNEILSDILAPYSMDRNVKTIKSARDEFVLLTGPLDEDSNEYESRLNSFEEWFVFNYQSQKILKKYLHSQEEMPEALKRSLGSVNHSVFHFKKINMFGKAVFVDLISKKTFKINHKKMKLVLVEGDLFTGRFLNYAADYFLLKGICLLPQDAYHPIKKQIKKLRKLGIDEYKETFLMEIERFKTKSLHYGHVNAKDIFIFA